MNPIIAMTTLQIVGVAMMAVAGLAAAASALGMVSALRRLRPGGSAIWEGGGGQISLAPGASITGAQPAGGSVTTSGVVSFSPPVLSEREMADANATCFRLAAIARRMRDPVQRAAAAGMVHDLEGILNGSRPFVPPKAAEDQAPKRNSLLEQPEQ